MKLYRLTAWPDLPATLQRTAHRRMLHQMSQRFVSVSQLMQESGLPRHDVIQFLDQLAERELLSAQEPVEPDSRFGQLAPVLWLRRTFASERPA